MRRRTFARDLMGTIITFIVIIVVVVAIIYGEQLLDHFKSH